MFGVNWSRVSVPAVGDLKVQTVCLVVGSKLDSAL
jgi:hypothetical protein